MQSSPCSPAWKAPPLQAQTGYPAGHIGLTVAAAEPLTLLPIAGTGHVGQQATALTHAGGERSGKGNDSLEV